MIGREFVGIVRTCVLGMGVGVIARRRLERRGQRNWRDWGGVMCGIEGERKWLGHEKEAVE